ncbi:MAG: DsbA family protein, partial [Halioglobus sp.]|nr:DsbA family protein [Halioglobus sp.]
MAEQFKEQGGAATMDPNPVLRWATSTLMTQMCRPQRLTKQRAKFEKARAKAGAAHVVEYYHQVEDGYSHLAAQVLQSLAERYDIEIVCHLVQGPQGKNAAEPELLLQLSRYDAFHVAGEYGLAFPRHDEALRPDLVQLATAILAAQDNQAFIERAAEVGSALWAGDEAALEHLAQQCGRAPESAVSQRIATGMERREALRHYSGAMFYYGGEWYWGVDRLYHLEQRFADLGIDRKPAEKPLVPRPVIPPPVLKDDGRLTLEIYPSLRSPYTAISFDRAVKLARDTGVNLVVRPVLPMVMRGVPATREKGMYIFWDTAREARAAGVPFGNFYDPIGNPARNGYSLFSWASEQGKGVELISAFLRCAFAEGVNLNNERGLQKVVEKAGLNWHEAAQKVGQSGWEDMLETNRLAMYHSGLWGVPSFRLLDDTGEQILALWGQDRLWLIAREIQRQL